MYLSLNGTLTSGRAPWPEFARLAAKVGFPGVDVSLDAAMKAGAAASHTLLEQLHLRPAVLGFPVEYRKDDATFQHDLERLDDAGQFAKAIQCPRMVTWITSSSETPKRELRALYKKRFSAAAAILAKHDVRLGLEFLGPLHIRTRFPHEFIWRMNEMLEFAQECGFNCGLLLDSWHWHHAGATPADIVAAGKRGIVHVHFNDAAMQPPEKVMDNERLMPGEGVINLTGFLQALKQIGYQDALSVEVFGRGLKFMTPEDAAKLGLESAQRVFHKAGIRA
jgi:sugar phosphate isomerase/epimerase